MRASTNLSGPGERVVDPTVDRSLPNFLIIGAQKAGTTALYYYLRQHPEIFMSRVKEPQFFAFVDREPPSGGPGDADSHSVTTISAYRELFAGRRHEPRAGEASTIYLYDESAPVQIRRVVPDVKLIGILRDPAERAYSNFQHLRRDGREPIEDFSEALAAEPMRTETGWSANWRYLDKGFYAPQIERYFDTFSREQLLWILYEEFDRDPHRIVRDIYRFLGVEDCFAQDLSLRLNVAGVPKKGGLRAFVSRQEQLKWWLDPYIPAPIKRRLLSFQNTNLIRSGLPPDLRRRLTDLYRPDVERVQALTGLDCSEWLVA